MVIKVFFIPFFLLCKELHVIRYSSLQVKYILLESFDVFFLSVDSRFAIKDFGLIFRNRGLSILLVGAILQLHLLYVQVELLVTVLLLCKLCFLLGNFLQPKVSLLSHLRKLDEEFVSPLIELSDLLVSIKHITLKLFLFQFKNGYLVVEAVLVDHEILLVFVYLLNDLLQGLHFAIPFLNLVPLLTNCGQMLRYGLLGQPQFLLLHILGRFELLHFDSQPIVHGRQCVNFGLHFQLLANDFFKLLLH